MIHALAAPRLLALHGAGPQRLTGGRTSDDLVMVDDLKGHVQQAVGKWKYPRWIEVVDDLPKTATGKIQRFRLREQVA